MTIQNLQWTMYNGYSESIVDNLESTIDNFESTCDNSEFTINNLESTIAIQNF